MKWPVQTHCGEVPKKLWDWNENLKAKKKKEGKNSMTGGALDVFTVQSAARRSGRREEEITNPLRRVESAAGHMLPDRPTQLRG